MAEVVQLRIERGVEELLELERAELFTPEEIKAIIKKRKHFEYRLRSFKVTKDDFLKYISYEQCLLKLIKIRRKKSGFTHRVKQVDHVISHRIASLFGAAVVRYKSDADLWMTYISFCKDLKWFGTASNVYRMMLQVLNKHDNLWVSAAKFEFDDNNSMSSARVLMQKGLRFNPDSELLYREFFRLELLYMDKIVKRRKLLLEGSSARKRKRSEGEDSPEEEQSGINQKSDENDFELTNDSILSGKVAMVIFEAGLDKIADVPFALSFLDLLIPFREEYPELTTRLEDEILSLIQDKFPNDELVQTVKIKNLVKNFSKDTTPTPSTVDVIDKTIELFREAVTSLGTEKIWSSFLTTLLEYMSNAQYSKKIRKHLAVSLQSLFEEAFESDKLSPDLFMEWVFLEKAVSEGSTKDTLKLNEIIIKGTGKWGDKPVVWTACMSVLTQMTQSITLDQHIQELFKRGIEKMSLVVKKTPNHGSGEQEDILRSIQQFVVMFIEWGIERKLSSKQLLSILESSSNGKTFSLSTSIGRSLCSVFKSYLLEKAVVLDELEAAFQYYQKYKDHHPVSQSFYQTMISLTKKSNLPSMNETVDSLFEDYLKEFGSDDHSIWMEFARHLIDSDRVTLLPSLYNRAVKSLNTSEGKAFMEMYSDSMREMSE